MHNKLKGAMREQGITQTKLAKSINIAVSTLNLKLNGKCEFRVKEAIKISEIIKIPVEEIFK